MAIMAILKVFVFVKFVEVYGAFAFAPSYMCLYTCIVEFLIFSPSTRISEANGITIGVLKAMVIYMYKLNKKNVPVEVFNDKNLLIFFQMWKTIKRHQHQWRRWRWMMRKMKRGKPQ